MTEQHDPESLIDGPLTLRASIKAASHAAGATRGFFRGTRQAITPHIHGQDNIPEGPAILACNHRLASDFSRLTTSLKQPLKLVDLRPTGKKKPAHAIPLENSEAGHCDALSVLRAGEQLVVFPEGSPSPDGYLHKGSADVAWLALTCQVPVVPVGIQLSEHEGLGGYALSRLLGPTINIGTALDFSRYWTSPALSDVLDGVLLRGCTAEIMAAIAELSGQIYQDDSPGEAKDSVRQRRRLEARDRAAKYPTRWQQRRQAAIRREQLRAEDRQDLERAAAEAARNAQHYVQIDGRD